MKHFVESFISEELTDGGQWLSAALVSGFGRKDQSNPDPRQSFVGQSRRAGTDL